MSIDLQFVREAKSITLVVFCRQLDTGDQGRCSIFPIERLHLGARAEHHHDLPASHGRVHTLQNIRDSEECLTHVRH